MIQISIPNIYNMLSHKNILDQLYMEIIPLKKKLKKEFL